MNNQRPIIIAACGDVHGRMHQMQEQLLQVEQCTGLQIDLVLQVGDFQPIRNEHDLASLKVPSKYRSMGDFPDFYQGASRFNWPVWFIGGNHEPVTLLDQHPEGAELVANCHYLGRVGQLQWQGLTIAGLSGIYQEETSRCARAGTEKTVEEPRARTLTFSNHDIDRLISLPRPDILLLHDWPACLACPDQQGRFSSRGCDISRTVVELLEPQLVLCGHQHYPYQAEITTASGRSCHICCLDQVDPARPGCIALFRYTVGAGFEQLDRYTGAGISA